MHLVSKQWAHKHLAACYHLRLDFAGLTFCGFRIFKFTVATSVPYIYIQMLKFS